MLKWYIESVLVWTIILAVLFFAIWRLGLIDADEILNKKSGAFTLYATAFIVALIPFLRIFWAVGSVFRILETIMED